MTSIAKLQKRVTYANEAVQRLSNKNRKLTGSLANQNQQAINELVDRDAEIQRISELLRENETAREGLHRSGIDEIALRDGHVIVLRKLIKSHEATID